MSGIKNYVIIVAGGSGSRMKAAVPKQFIKINGLPLLMYSFKAFSQYDPNCEFILVLPTQQIGRWNQLCKECSFEQPHQIVDGGPTRFHSVRNGLEHVKKEGIVFIHDGVRPLVSLQTIKNCHEGAIEKGNALPVIAPSESIRELIGESNRAADRNRFFLVQTPQTFTAEIITEAYKQNYQERFTDDASVLENLGYKINLVEGNRENIKITYPEDIKFAKALMSNT